MLRAIIVDDELIGINALKLLIETYTQELKVVATSSDPEKGIMLVDDYKPEVLFLDVSMPKFNGFELLEKLHYKNFKLVFTTAYEGYALKAIKKRAYDYLLKPIDVDELKNCVFNLVHDTDRTISPLVKDSLGLIELPVRDGIHFIRPQDIIRVEAEGSYSTFYLVNNTKHVVSKNLKECEALLKPLYFYRCHASHIINLRKVAKLVNAEGLFVKMIDGSIAKIGRRSKEEFLDKLKSI